MLQRSQRKLAFLSFKKDIIQIKEKLYKKRERHKAEAQGRQLLILFNKQYCQ